MKLLICSFLIILFFSECRYPCGSGGADIALVNYDDPGNDTLIIRRYKKNSAFTILHDTATVFRGSNANFQINHDTALILASPFNGKATGTIESSYDYEIYLSREKRIYKITSIKENLQYGSKSGPKIYCINPITEYTLDGKKISGKGSYQYIYLDK